MLLDTLKEGYIGLVLKGAVKGNYMSGLFRSKIIIILCKSQLNRLEVAYAQSSLLRLVPGLDFLYPGFSLLFYLV